MDKEIVGYRITCKGAIYGAQMSLTALHSAILFNKDRPKATIDEYIEFLKEEVSIQLERGMKNEDSTLSAEDVFEGGDIRRVFEGLMKSYQSHKK